MLPFVIGPAWLTGVKGRYHMRAQTKKAFVLVTSVLLVTILVVAGLWRISEGKPI